MRVQVGAALQLVEKAVGQGAAEPLFDLRAGQAIAEAGRRAVPGMDDLGQRDMGQQLGNVHRVDVAARRGEASLPLLRPVRQKLGEQRLVQRPDDWHVFHSPGRALLVPEPRRKTT